jgi:hypothetical protein
LPRGWTSSSKRRGAETTGGVTPVGHPEPLRTIVDIALSRYDAVWASGGHPHCVFPTNYDEPLRITGGEAADVGAETSGLGLMAVERIAVATPCLAAVTAPELACNMAVDMLAKEDLDASAQRAQHDDGHRRRSHVIAESVQI